MVDKLIICGLEHPAKCESGTPVNVKTYAPGVFGTVKYIKFCSEPNREGIDQCKYMIKVDFEVDVPKEKEKIKNNIRIIRIRTSK